MYHACMLFICAYINISILVCIYICKHVYIYAYIDIYMHIYIHKYMLIIRYHAYINIYICIYRYMHVYIHEYMLVIRIRIEIARDLPSQKKMYWIRINQSPIYLLYIYIYNSQYICSGRDYKKSEKIYIYINIYPLSERLH